MVFPKWYWLIDWRNHSHKSWRGWHSRTRNLFSVLKCVRLCKRWNWRVDDMTRSSSIWMEFGVGPCENGPFTMYVLPLKSVSFVQFLRGVCLVFWETGGEFQNTFHNQSRSYRIQFFITPLSLRNRNKSSAWSWHCTYHSASFHQAI